MLYRLHTFVKGVCPIEGLAPRTPGTTAGPGNVRIDYSPLATDQQRAAADVVVAAFDWSQAAQEEWEQDQKPEQKSLRQQANQAVTDNDTYLSIATPSPGQVAAQVRRLTQQNNRIIPRLIQVD